MFTMCNAAFNECWDTATTKLNNDGMFKLGDVHTNRSEFINFYERDLINEDSSFCSHILLAIDLHCHVFPFEKFLQNVRLRV